MRSLAALLMSAFAFAAAAPAETYLVAPDGSGDFPTIRAAIEAVVDGDVIELADGTFRGEGNRDLDYLGKAVTIRSQSGNPEACVIDCEGSASDYHWGFQFSSGEGASSILEGVTVSHAYGVYGAAVTCTGGSAPALLHCVFSDNTAIYGGGGLVFNDSSPSVRACVLARNAGGSGGAVASCFESSPEFATCRFEDNTASAQCGGAIYI